MKNNIKIVSILFFLLMLTSCGFKPILQKSNNLVYINNVKIFGEQRIAYILKNKILLISNVNSKNKYDVEIKITKKKSNKIKNEKGKIMRYDVTISADLKLINLDSGEIINNIFIEKSDYDIGNNHSDTINNEKSIIKNIVQGLAENIINFIKLSMRNL